MYGEGINCYYHQMRYWKFFKNKSKYFIALFIIIFIGAFFLSSSISNIKDSVINYRKENLLYDFEIFTDKGFSEDDLSALKNVFGVEDAYGSRIFDSDIADEYGHVFKAKIRELNDVSLIRGYYPENDDECLIIKRYNLGNIGQELVIKNQKYYVTGIAQSCEYMSRDFVDFDLVIYLPESNFSSDNYNRLYIKGNVDRDTLIELADERLGLLKMDVESLDELWKHKNTLQKELDDAKLLLDEAKDEIEKGDKEIVDKEKLLNNKQKELDKARETLAEKKNQFDAELKKAENTAGMSIEEMRNTVSSAYSQYQSAVDAAEQASSAITLLEVERNVAQSVANSSGYANVDEVRQAISRISDINNPEYLRLRVYEEAFVLLESAEQNLATLRETYNYANEAINTINNTSLERFNMSITDANNYVNGLYNQFSESKQQLLTAQDEIDNGQKQIDNGFIQLKNAKNKLIEAKAEYEENEKKYLEAKADFDSAYQEGLDVGSRWYVNERKDDKFESVCSLIEKYSLIASLLIGLLALLCSFVLIRDFIYEQDYTKNLLRNLGIDITKPILLFILLVSILAAGSGIVTGTFIWPKLFSSAMNLVYDLPKIGFSFKLSDILYFAILSLLPVGFAYLSLKKKITLKAYFDVITVSLITCLLMICFSLHDATAKQHNFSLTNGDKLYSCYGLLSSFDSEDLVGIIVDGDDDVAVSSSLAKKNNFKINDEVRIQSSKEAIVNISNIKDDISGDFVYMSKSYYQKTFGAVPANNSCLIELSSDIDKTIFYFYILPVFAFAILFLVILFFNGRKEKTKVIWLALAILIGLLIGTLSGKLFIDDFAALSFTIKLSSYLIVSGFMLLLILVKNRFAI